MRAKIIAAAALALASGACTAQTPKAAAVPPAPAPKTDADKYPPEKSLAEKNIPAKIPANAFVLDGPLVQGGLVRGQAPVGAISVTLNGASVKMALDGSFVIGFGPDAPEKYELVAQTPDGALTRKIILVQPRAWNEQRVNGVPPKTVNIPENEKARRAGEIAQIRAARSVVSDLRGWQQKFIWPAQGPISGIYGSRRVYNGQPGSQHLGVDVAKPKGTPVLAPADGVVKLAAPDFLLEGGLLIIDHGFGIYSSFLHLSRLDVKPGDTVTQGQAIAAIGGTGRATGPHLHWNLNWNDVRLDAQLLMPKLEGRQPAPIKPAAPPSQTPPTSASPRKTGG